MRYLFDPHFHEWFMLHAYFLKFQETKKCQKLNIKIKNDKDIHLFIEDNFNFFRMSILLVIFL